MTTTSQLPGLWTAVFYQGATFEPILTVTQNGIPFDFTGYTGLMKVRKASGDIILTLSTADNKITMSNLGVITFNVSATITSSLPAGTWVHDLLVTSPAAIVIPIVAGPALVVPSPTGAA